MLVKYNTVSIILVLSSCAAHAQNYDNPCYTPNPCVNGGTCKVVNDETYECECDPGYSGDNCQNSICFPSHCQNGGNCKVDNEGIPKCECGIDWIGVNCTVDNPCHPDPCKHDGRCNIEIDGSAICFCSDGWLPPFCNTNSNSTTTVTSVPTSTTRLSTSTVQTSPSPKDLTACSAFSASKCSWEKDSYNEGDMEQFEGVENIQNCQFYCRSVYDETCKYFIYRTTTKTCFIFNLEKADLCMQTGGSIQVNATECNQVFLDRVDIHDCSNFREHNCEYVDLQVGEVMRNTVEECQVECKKNENSTAYCGFFTYNSETRSCSLYRSGKRHCEQVIGSPHPNYEKCHNEGYIKWPEHDDSNRSWMLLGYSLEMTLCTIIIQILVYFNSYTIF